MEAGHGTIQVDASGKPLQRQVGETGRAGQVQAGLRDAVRSGAVGWSFRGQRCVASDTPGGSVTAESGSGAPDRAPGGAVRHGGAAAARVQLQLAGLRHVGMGRTACGPTDHNTSALGVEAGGSQCARDGGRRRSQEISSSRTAAGVSNRGWGDAATCEQALWSRGFPRAVRRRDNECVVRLFQVFPPRNLGGGPYLRICREIEPCSPESGSSGTSAGPLREVVEGLSPCSPAGCFTRREDSDGHAATGQASLGTRRIRSMAALGGLSYGALLSMPWAAGATRSWRRFPFASRKGVRMRTPFRGMPIRRSMPHNRRRDLAFQRFLPRNLGVPSLTRRPDRD